MTTYTSQVTLSMAESLEAQQMRHNSPASLGHLAALSFPDFTGNNSLLLKAFSFYLLTLNIIMLENA